MNADLQKTLAEEYTLLLKTHNFHWNVEGPLFFSLHKLFEEQYNTIFVNIDTIAERVRALNARAPGSYKEFQQLSTIEDAPSDHVSASQMIDILTKDHTSMTARFKERRDKADEARDAATADIYNMLIEFHDKAAWMIRSHKS